MRRTLLLLCCITFLFGRLAAQNHTISGTVTDAMGAPVVGATISVKGTNRAAASGNDGSFAIAVSGKDKTLIISAINFATQEVDIAGKTSIGTVVLKQGTKNLDEVVVVAYGTQKKSNVTGAVGTINGAQVADKPFASVDQALQGATPGLMVSSPNGIPGSGVDVLIRGIGSINASANPLWVIDGAIATTSDLASTSTSTNPLSGLNPDDIESISVLKDASATALYGSRAANGVILVTTKRGKAGKTRINFTTEIGKNSVAFANNNNKPLNTPQYHQLLVQSILNDTSLGISTAAQADAYIIDPVNGLGLPTNWQSTNTDWLHDVTRTGNQQQYNLSLSGGNDKTQYFASAGYFTQDGTTIGTTFKRYNGNVNVTNKASDRLLFSVGISGSYSSQLAPPGGAAYASPVSGAFFLPPYYSPYNADGSLRYNDSLGEFPQGSQFNPLVIAKWNRYTAGQLEFRGFVSGEYQIIDNLKFTSKFSGEFIDLNEYQYWNPLYGDGWPLGYGAATDRKVFNWTWTNQFNYRANFNSAKDFYLDLLAGTEAFNQSDYTVQGQGNNFPSTTTLTYLASAATPIGAYNLPQGNSVNSYLSQAVFNYQDRYILSGSYRLDGSSVFAQNHKWGSFYSVGGSWNVNEEQFLKDVTSLDILKLRASYGVTGNTIGFGDYPALATFSYGSPYEGSAGSALNNVGNPNLTWELNKIFNVGVDWGLWKNRLGGSIDWYKRTTSQLLLNVPLSPTAGAPLPTAGALNGIQTQNVGSMYNEGIEITLTGKPVQTRDFTWTSSINFSHNKNRVTELYNHAPVSVDTRYNITEGHDVHEFYTRLWAGANPANGDPQWYTDATKKSITSTYSQVKLSLTGKIGTPQYFGSFTNTFNYKGLSLTAQLFYNFGNYIYSTWENYLESDGTYLPNTGQLSNELNGWTHPGQVTNVPAVKLFGNMHSNAPSTRYLYKGNYIRLRNIELAYSLPKSTVDKAKINNVTIYVRGTNLATFATDKYLAIDPELGATSLANFQVFLPKTITAGIKLGF